MIVFWALVFVMVALAIYVMLRSLGTTATGNDSDRYSQNIAIARERIKELEDERASGILSEEEYSASREELEQALLSDIEQGETDKTAVNNPAQGMNKIKIVVLTFIPVVALALYAYLGQPGLVEVVEKSQPAHAGDGNKSKVGSIEEMVQRLADRLKTQPDNVDGWLMLGRSYMSLNMYQKAAEAYAKTLELLPNNPVVMLRYADALAMANKGKLEGKPFELIQKAVKLKPTDTMGLWLLGMAHEEKGNYRQAISHWKKLLTLLKDEKSQNQVKALIGRAESKAGIKSRPEVSKSKPVTSSGLQVTVSIAKDKLASVQPDATVFIFARAVSGPPMPLAVVRKKVSDLPVTVMLDDSMAMMPAMKLSAFNKVKIVARVSVSGSAKPSPGDIESDVFIADSNQKATIKLHINKIIP